MSNSPRIALESPVILGANEEKALSLTIPDSWGTVSNPANSLEDLDGNDKDTLLSGSPSAVAQVITTSLISGLTAGTGYLLRVTFEDGSEVIEALCYIECDL